MDTKRIIINTIDKSETASTADYSPVTAYTVINAPKGRIKPVFVNKGAFSRFKEIFGESSKEYTDLYEVETFLRGYGAYISAPYAEAEVPCAVLTDDGIFNLFDTDNDKPFMLKYNEALEAYMEGEGDIPTEISNLGSSTNKAKVLKKPLKTEITTDGLKVTGLKKRFGDSVLSEDFRMVISFINGNSFVIKGATEDSSFTGFTFIKGVKSDEYSSLGCTYTAPTPIEGTTDEKDDDALVIPLTVSPLSDINSETLSTVDVYVMSNEVGIAKAVILPKYPSSRAIEMSFGSWNERLGYIASDLDSRRTLKITTTEYTENGEKVAQLVITGSITDTTRDSSGALIGFNNLDSYKTQNIFSVIKLDDNFDLTKTPIYSDIRLGGGYKVFTNSITTEEKCYNKGWALAVEPEYSDVDIFFNVRKYESTKTDKGITDSDEFFALGKDDSRKVIARFIYNLTPSSTKQEDLNEYSQLDCGHMYWNIMNRGLIGLSNGDTIVSPLVGSYALMIAYIIENKFGGAAPMYTNTNGMGGQLTIPGLQKLVHKYKADALETLDELNYNPIINDRTYGVMVVGQRTSRKGARSDWSYIGHVSAFYSVYKEIKNNVMIPQLGKANNDYYRELRSVQVGNILSKRTAGNDSIWAEATWDTSTNDGVNDATNRDAKKFVINVAVKVNIFSEKVVLNFENVGQSTILS